MTDTPIVTSFTTLAPIIIQKYESYLPTAFNESLTLLQKVNMIIQSLSTTNDTVNSVIEQWNDQIVPYVNGDAFKTDISNKLDQMASDGTLDALINTNLIGSLSSLITTDKTSIVNAINEVETNLDVTNTNLAEISVNIKSNPYNAKGTPVDDTSAIQSAINYVSSIGGGVVLIPTGTFNHTGLTLPSNVSLHGTGSASSILYNTSSNDALTISGNSTTQKTNMFIKDLQIKGNNATSGHGINLSYATNLVILENLDVIYNNKGIVTNNCWTIRVKNVRTQWNRSHGMDIESNSNNMFLDGVVSNFNTGIGIYSRGNTSIMLLNVDCEGNHQDGLSVDGGSSCIIIGGYYEQNGQDNGNTLYSDIRLGRDTTFPPKIVEIIRPYINSKNADSSIGVDSVSVLNIERPNISSSGITTKAIDMKTGADKVVINSPINTGMTINDATNKAVIIGVDNNSRSLSSNGNFIQKWGRGTDAGILTHRFMSGGALRGEINLDPTTNDLVFGRWQGVAGSETYKEYGRFQQTGAVFKLPLGMVLTPVTASTSLNNQIFIDSSDNKLKFKDSAGVIQLLY